MSIRTSIFPLLGGLDLVTPAVNMQPGRLVACSNYESSPRGYARVDGFERFDGQPKPSEATYYRLNFDAGTTAISKDDEITGATSGATGTAVANAVVVSGSWGGNDAAGYIPLVDVTGTFQDDEDLEVSAAVVAVADGTQSLGSNQTHIDQATDARRAAITAVPGSGDVRGVWEYKGDIYAFRDNAGGTACIMHKATISGWEEITPSSTLPFTQGGAWVIEFSQPNSDADYTLSDVITPQVGDTIEQTSYGTTVWSGGKVISTETTITHWTGTIKQIVVDSGTFAGQDAVGRFVVQMTDRDISPSGSGHCNMPGYAPTTLLPMNGLMFAAITDATLLKVEIYDLITGVDSAETAIVTRIRIDTGAWEDNDAIGEFIITDASGTFSDEGVTTSNDYAYLDTRYFADVTGTEQATGTLPAGGRYDFVNYNFLGSSTAILEDVPDSVLSFDLES